MDFRPDSPDPHAMTKAENRAAKAWHEERERQRREEAQARLVEEVLAALGRLRSFLIRGRTSGDTRSLIKAIDNYVNSAAYAAS